MSDNENTHDQQGRPLPSTDPNSFYPDRMLPIHNDRHCPNLERRAWLADGVDNDPAAAADYRDDFIGGAWDGWLGFTPAGSFQTPGYVEGRVWGINFRSAGSPW